MAWYDHHAFREENGERIPGVFFPAIIHNSNYYFTHIAVYKDKKIDCWGLCTLDEFMKKVNSGWVTNTIPANEELDIHHFATIKIIDCKTYGTMEDFMKDIISAIEHLNDRPTAQEKFIDAIKMYKKEPSERSIKKLKLACNELPKYYYKYCFGSQFERHKEIQEILNISKEST